MPDPPSDVQEAAERRAAAFADGAELGGQLRAAVPGGSARCVSTAWMRRHRGASPLAVPQLRAKKVDRDGKAFNVLEGYYTVYEAPYEMYDWYGQYTEVVTLGAGTATIEAKPDVVYLENHKGLSLARTINSTLELLSDDVGCFCRAWLNPNRDDVKRLVLGVEDGTVTEQSFAFMIVKGHWSPDYTEYRIDQFDQDRGDCSSVNYGANPHTNVAARAREILDELDRLPVGAARAALDRLQHRIDAAAQMTPPPVAVPAQMTPPAPQTRTEPEPANTTRTLTDVDAWLAMVDDIAS